MLGPCLPKSLAALIQSLFISPIVRKLRNMLKEYVAELAKYKKLGHQVLMQVTDEALNYLPGSECNSIAIIVCHLNGNLLSRFTDFLTTDGEKPWRDRTAEFGKNHYTRQEVEALWTIGWSQIEITLAELTNDDLPKMVSIKGNSMTVDRALCRTLAHVAYHVGQMVLLGRVTAGENWQYLSTPPAPKA